MVAGNEPAQSCRSSPLLSIPPRVPSLLPPSLSRWTSSITACNALHQQTLLVRTTRGQDKKKFTVRAGKLVKEMASPEQKKRPPESKPDASERTLTSLTSSVTAYHHPLPHPIQSLPHHPSSAAPATTTALATTPPPPVSRCQLLRSSSFSVNADCVRCGNHVPRGASFTVLRMMNQ